MPNTIRLHRVLRTNPEKIYRAFLDARALAKWLAPHGFTAEVHELDARVGGTHRMSFTNFTTGHPAVVTRSPGERSNDAFAYRSDLRVSPGQMTSRTHGSMR